MQDKPIMCSLSAGEFETREAEWREILRHGVIERRETPEGFMLSIERDERVLAEIKRLAALESGCCAWMEIALDDGDPIVLTMTSRSPGGKEVIAMLVPAIAP